MAEYRTIRMSFWADPFIEELESGAKLLYLYLFTGPHTNNLGIVEVTRRKIAFETGLSAADVDAHIVTLADAGKIICDSGQILLCNFIRNQTTTSPKIMQSLRKMIPSVQSQLFRDALCLRYPMLFNDADDADIPHIYPIHTVSHDTDTVSQGTDTLCIPSPELEEEGEEEIEENTASASPPAELTPPAPVPPVTTQPPALPVPGPMPASAPSARKQPRKAQVPEPDEPHYRAKSGRYITGKRLEGFGQFWTAFDFAKGKAEAADAWLDIPQLTESLVAQICQAARAEAAGRGGIEARGGTPKWAQGWLNARRWEDYVPAPSVASKSASASAAGYVPAYDLPPPTPEQAEAARLVRERLIRERHGRMPPSDVGTVAAQGAAP